MPGVRAVLKNPVTLPGKEAITEYMITLLLKYLWMNVFVLHKFSRTTKRNIVLQLRFRQNGG